ncbi:flagellar motor protein MotB [Clostridium sp. OS1-26]|uniref:flagellar motor protein MotB n=1 Tax=Clostridium sp. OS1-26 TaxID=3070681 RepID=UPI0027E0C2DD|nr:flagellar motor protein MotB [Clostridium sp. OS1-26]WML35453.1 flagellar motor protein MotB [Clostridium sp. OS1-26]
MKGKKQHHEEHVDETWLLPYSDMMTLLLALFIVMFAMSKVDNQKAKQLSHQFNVVFSGGSGALQSNGSNGDTFKIDDLDTLNEKSGVIEQDKMLQVKNTLEQSIKNDGYADKVKVELNGEGLDIRIQDTVLFNSGEADILNEFTPVLMKISNMIKDLDNEIKISGHTDNVPIKNEKFRSNWDLSYMRASNVMNFMVDKCDFSPDKFSIQAYGEFKAKYNNSTEDGRSKNRSVDILIVRRYVSNSKNAN